MSKDVKILDDLADYIHQLKRHTEGRRALHIRLSTLERHFREEHYRRFAAAAFRPLVAREEAILYALPNADLVLITKDASVDQVDTLLTTVRRKLSDSKVLSGLDPIQGISDAFVEWFDLATEYDAFKAYAAALTVHLKSGVETPVAAQPTETSAADEPAGLRKITLPEEKGPSLVPRHVKMVPVSAPTKDIAVRELDPALLMTLTRALASADVTSLLRRQSVKAVVGDQPPMPVMIHKMISESVVYETLLEAKVLAENRWLRGYLEDYLAERLLACGPNMKVEGSLAASLRLTCNSIMNAAFSKFNAAQPATGKSKIILELGASDVLANFSAYQALQQKIVPEGYRIAIADVDLRALLWLDYSNFQADFIKVSIPSEPMASWVHEKLEAAIRERIRNIGIARLILVGCDTQDHISFGRKLGITLFQGDIIDPLHKL